MEPNDRDPSEDLPHTNNNGDVEDDWSSDEEDGAVAAGYMLLQNEDGSDEEESSFMASDEPVPSADGAEIDDETPDLSHSVPNFGIKPMSTEEEAKLREEAFANFDRNYHAVRHPTGF